MYREIPGFEDLQAEWHDALEQGLMDIPFVIIHKRQARGQERRAKFFETWGNPVFAAPEDIV